MAAAGVSGVCLANDHAMDYGAQGLEETLNVLRGVKMGACGAGSNRHAAGQPMVLKAPGGAGVALLSFSDVGPESYAAGEDTPGINAVSTLEELGEAVSAAAGAAPYVVVFFHWGEKGGREITSRQREIAYVCARAGADLVVGCHPHVVQGIEIVEGAPVIYSLGDLLYNGRDGSGEGLVASCRFDDGALRSLRLFPVRAGKQGAELARGEEARRLLDDLAAASPGVDLRVSPGGDSVALVLK
jgi:poly-gamma-glutamate synthesis protein (capsule biosynthesis protein)